MSLLEIILIAIGLAMDAFAVAVASAIIMERITVRPVFRLGFHFGLFQALMPYLGWLAGRSFLPYISQWDHWVAFALLSAIGGKAIYGSFRQDDDNYRQGDPSRGVTLIVLAVATSIDALAAGVSFAMLEVAIWYPCVIIGVVTAGLTTGGVLLGGRLGMCFGRRMELFGGIVLIAIGVKILVEHLA